MKVSTAGPRIVVMGSIAMLLGQAQTAAQSDGAPRSTAAVAPALTAQPVGWPAPTSTDAPAPGSSVSPAIERFMKVTGRGVPEAPANLPAIKPLAMPADLPASRKVPQPRIRSTAELEAVRDGRGTPDAPAIASTRRLEPPAFGAAPPPPPALALEPPPLEPTDRAFPINLATALRLSDARPLIVAAAQAGVWIAEAQLTRAKVLWIPTFTFATDYYRHDGGAPDFNKGVMTVQDFNYFYGGVGLNQYVNLTDAIFEPLAARQVLSARHQDIQSAKNDSLMMTADSYFRVHQYRGMYAGALYNVERGHELIVRISELSKELVPTVEVDRAKNFVADLQQRAVSAREQWRVESARLTRVLRLDPRSVIVPLEHDHTQISLIDPARPLEDLMPIALSNRPEIASRQALLAAAELRVRREKMRPLLPIAMLNGLQAPGMYTQAGIFALGPNASLNNWVGRDDISFQLIWQLENFGIGNLAKVKNQRSAESQAIIDLRNSQDKVAAEVTQAQARLQSAAARVVQADRALRTGIITFQGNLEGIGQTRRLENVLVLVNRPQEAVYALDLLSIAFNEYFMSVSDYNRAQFELFHAMGYPARELAELRPPGEVLPVDLARPTYLPPVGNGPPPATR
jgi:outer membrane protein TolC